MRQLSLNDYRKAAFVLGVPVNNLMAVAQVESAGKGFQSDGQPKILFEGHIFRRLTKHKYDMTHPEISYRYSSRYRRKSYKENQHEKLGKAVSLNRAAALSSCSWGKFQIMGFNYKACGYKSLQKFINHMYLSEAGHLCAFIGFVKHKNLVGALRRGDFAKFAYGYNGSSYRDNRYDEKMAKAAAEFKHIV